MVGTVSDDCFEIWVPQEYLPHMLSFMMFNRDDITVLVHPLGKTEVRDHTVDAMWLGNPYPIGNKDPCKISFL